MTLYRSFEDCYVPLWMLGYCVPLSHVRKALYEPLRGMIDAIESEVDTSGDLEDLIDDAVSKHSARMKRRKADVLQVPKGSLEAFVNILFNREYNLDDDPFKRGIEELREWQGQYQLRNRKAEITTERGDCDSVKAFLDRAPFIKKYLSLNQLKQAVEECTDHDLSIVERDLAILREMAFSIREIVQILTRDMGSEFEGALSYFLPDYCSVDWSSWSISRCGATD